MLVILSCYDCYRYRKGSSSSISSVSQTPFSKTEGTDPLVERHLSSERSSDSSSLSQSHGSLDSPQRSDPSRAPQSPQRSETSRTPHSPLKSETVSRGTDVAVPESPRPQRSSMGSARRGSDSGLRSLELSIQTVPEDQDIDSVREIIPRRGVSKVGDAPMSPSSQSSSQSLYSVQSTPESAPAVQQQQRHNRAYGSADETALGNFQRGGARSASTRAYRSPQVSRRFLDSHKYAKEFHALQHYSEKDRDVPGAMQADHAATLQHPKCTEHTRTAADHARSAEITKLKLASGEHSFCVRDRVSEPQRLVHGQEVQVPKTAAISQVRMQLGKQERNKQHRLSPGDYSTLQHLKAKPGTSPSSHEYASLTLQAKKHAKEAEDTPSSSKYRMSKGLADTSPPGQAARSRFSSHINYHINYCLYRLLILIKYQRTL